MGGTGQTRWLQLQVDMQHSTSHSQWDTQAQSICPSHVLYQWDKEEFSFSHTFRAPVSTTRPSQCKLLSSHHPQNLQPSATSLRISPICSFQQKHKPTLVAMHQCHLLPLWVPPECVEVTLPQYERNMPSLPTQYKVGFRLDLSDREKRLTRKIVESQNGLHSGCKDQSLKHMSTNTLH